GLAGILGELAPRFLLRQEDSDPEGRRDAQAVVDGHEREAEARGDAPIDDAVARELLAGVEREDLDSRARAGEIEPSGCGESGARGPRHVLAPPSRLAALDVQRIDSAVAMDEEGRAVRSDGDAERLLANHAPVRSVDGDDAIRIARRRDQKRALVVADDRRTHGHSRLLTGR